MARTLPYTGRFAPSPTGPLHAGSMVAALASWLDARAHGGRWLVRIEDVDRERCVAGADRQLLRQLADCGLEPDEPPVWQSERGGLYAFALDALVAAGLAYPCGCSRRDIDEALAARGRPHQRHGERVYPGTCSQGLQGRPARVWRLRSDGPAIAWQDRRLGPQQQAVAREVGDFVLRRAEGGTAYQLAVVVDDAAQGVTDVVRGEDLADNTARQILLQRHLGLTTPRYLHTPLVRDARGEKLSKQTGATAVDTREPLAVLQQAARTLGLPPQRGPLDRALRGWITAWGHLYNPAP